MPRKHSKARRKPQKKEITVKPDYVIELIEKITKKDRCVHPGYIVAVAEYHEKGERDG